jgi:signal transduction histidine kinase
VSVDLSAVENDLVLKVTDSGKGFDTRGTAAHGLGLLSIRDRVTFLKGRLDIQSAPGAGTELATHIPIRTEASVSIRTSPVHI